MTDISKASLPITVVAAILMAGLGYWANAQDAKIEDNRLSVAATKEELAAQKLEIVKTIAEIRQQQALDAQTQTAILETLEAIKEKVDEQ